MGRSAGQTPNPPNVNNSGAGFQGNPGRNSNQPANPPNSFGGGSRFQGNPARNANQVPSQPSVNNSGAGFQGNPGRNTNQPANPPNSFGGGNQFQGNPARNANPTPNQPNGNHNGAGYQGNPGRNANQVPNQPNGNTNPGASEPGQQYRGNRPGFNGQNGAPGASGARSPNSAFGGQHPNSGQDHAQPQQNHSQNFRNAQPRGSSQRVARDGSAVQFRSNGRVRDVHDVHRGMDIHQGLNGSRQISVMHSDHGMTYYQRGRAGFVQRPYRFRDSDFARRTYVFHGRSYDRFYRGFGFRGLSLNMYAPSFYFGHAYYGWAYNPWGRSVRYNWGWASYPWYNYYGYYFQPDPVYSSAADWLTDYMISTDLQAAYAAQQDGGEMNGDPSGGDVAPLTPNVKQMIADEIRNQLALETQEAQMNAQGQDIDPDFSGIGRVLNDVANGRQHVFVAGSALDVVDGSGIECSLSDGDALAMRTAPPPDATSAELIVLSSKGGQECPNSDTVFISLNDLQEMQNHMRELIDQGLQTLQNNQGQGGLPAAPYSPPVTPAIYAGSAPPADPNAASQIQQTAQQADQAQNEVTSSVGPDGGANGPTPTVTAGQTIGQVEAIMGQPGSKAVLGQKIIYNYDGMKVIFINGRVTDVE
jgi:hypothetical protein